MSQSTGQHSPSPEFVNALESEVVAAFRRQSGFSVPPSVRRRRGVRTALTLVIGLAVGAGTVVASAQVQSNQQRDSLALSATLQRQMAVLLLELARTEFDQVQKAINVGARSRSDLTRVQLGLHAAELNIKRVDLELEEIRIAGAAARNELWAPLVGNRDFVSERLKLEAVLAQQRLAGAESTAEERRLRVMAGALAPSDTLDSRLDLSYANGEMQLVTRKLALRKRFLDRELDETGVTLEMKRIEMAKLLERTAELLKAAKQRKDRASEQHAIGMTTLSNVKRAELEVLERSDELEQLRQKLLQLNASTRKP